MQLLLNNSAVVALSVGLGLSLTSMAHAITLTQNGAPRATIVVEQSALAPAKDDASAQKVAIAAQDLQLYIRKMSGATLPIVGDAATPTGALVLVGKSKLTDGAKADIPSGLTSARDEEGFLIQSRGDRLVLAGNDAGPYHGTEYAVYNFLKRAGVRWFMPGDFGEVVPQSKTISFGDVTAREKPDFRMRDWWIHATPAMAALEARWKIRNGMNPDVIFAAPGDSSLRNFMPAPELATTQPELFAKRFDGSIDPYYPNLANPQTAQIAADKMKAYFRAHPEAGSIGIAPDDGLPRDFNPETLKLNQGFSDLVGREGVPSEMSNTEEWIAWVNAVTREVNKEFPDKIVTTNGYSNRNMPPFGVKIEPNVSIMFAAIWSDTLHAYDAPKSWQMVRQGELLQRWTELNNKVWIYGYDYGMIVSGLTPIPTTRKVARDFPLMKKWGVIGFYDETRNIWAERGTTKYIKAQLEWNANADVNALLTDYYAKWYGGAAKPARAFWDTLETTIENSPVLGHEDRVLPWVYTPQMLEELTKNISLAEAAAQTPTEKLHVRVDRLIYEHLNAYMAMNAAELSGNFAEAARQAKVMLAIRPQLNAINEFYILPSEKQADGSVDNNSGVFYWGIADRAAYYQKLEEMIDGTTGKLIAPLPQVAAFTTDPHDEGRFAGWFKSDWNTRDWKALSTAKPFYLQGYQDKAGHPYLGNMWYQFKTQVPASAQGKRVFLYAPVVEAEAWVWVNGQYVGHRPYRETYERPNELDMDVAGALRPGQTNVISIRVSTSANRTAVAGGLVGRLFLYSPNAAPATTPAVAPAP